LGRRGADSFTTSIQFSVVSNFENFAKITLVMYVRNRKTLHKLHYRHWHALSMTVFSIWKVQEETDSVNGQA